MYQYSTAKNSWMKDAVNGRNDNVRNEVRLTWPGKNDLNPGAVEKKIFTGFQLHSVNGVGPIEKFTGKDNFIIKGDNLVVLRSIRHVFAEQAKLIYIDPPYNTGNGKFNYLDNFNHS